MKISLKNVFGELRKIVRFKQNFYTGGDKTKNPLLT